MFQEVRNYPTVLDDLEEKFKISTDELKELKAMSVKAIKSSEEARVMSSRIVGHPLTLLSIINLKFKLRDFTLC